MRGRLIGEYIRYIFSISGIPRGAGFSDILYRWLQCVYIRLWPDWFWQNIYNGGKYSFVYIMFVCPLTFLIIEWMSMNTFCLEQVQSNGRLRDHLLSDRKAISYGRINGLILKINYSENTMQDGHQWWPLSTGLTVLTSMPKIGTGSTVYLRI